LPDRFFELFHARYIIAEPGGCQAKSPRSRRLAN
jgi:hypothetical protein